MADSTSKFKWRLLFAAASKIVEAAEVRTAAAGTVALDFGCCIIILEEALAESLSCSGQPRCFRCPWRHE